MSDLEFFGYFILIVIILLIFIWLFFGGNEVEYQGLDILLPPKRSSSNNHESRSTETCEIMKKSSINIKQKSSESTISTVIKFLPSYDIEYYRNFILPDKTRGIKRMEKKNAKESRGESICRNILEKFYGKPFPTVRPDFLLNPETGVNLELDCYNEELNLALEYNGYQHYEYPNAFHKTREEFTAQLRKDDLKKKICEAAGIYLIIVPHRIPHNMIPKYLEYYLPENVEHRRENGIEEQEENNFWDKEITVLPKNGFL